MAEMMQRTSVTTYASGVYVKDGNSTEFNDFPFAGKLDTVDRVMKVARREFGTRNLVVNPDSIHYDEHTYKIPMNLFVAVASAYEEGWFNIGTLRYISEKSGYIESE